MTEVYLKNINQTKYLKQLRPKPTTMTHVEMLVRLLDPYNIIRDINGVKRMSPQQLDLLYIVVSVNRVIFNQYIDTVTQYIVHHLMTLVTCQDYDSYIMVEDQLHQDVSYLLTVIFNLSDEKTIKTKLVSDLDEMFNTGLYPDLLTKAIRLKKYDKMFDRMATKIATFTRAVITKNMEIVTVVIDKLFDPMTRRDVIDSLLASFEKAFDLQQLIVNDPIYGEMVLDKRQSIGRAVSLL